MGKVFNDKICDQCGTKGKVIETWGKKLCKNCYNSRPKKGHGHSGMRKLSKLAIQLGLFFKRDELVLRRVPKGNDVFATLYLTHYPNSKGIVGRQLNYIVERNGDVVGIIGANSPPLNYKKFNNFFGEDYTELNWLNNNVYRLTTRERNLGTRVLKLFRKLVQDDYQKSYNDTLVGLVTFVEPPRDGALYRADNWTYLGMTEGKHCSRSGDHGKWINKEWSTGTKKHIFAKWLTKRRKNGRLLRNKQSNTDSSR